MVSNFFLEKTGGNGIVSSMLRICIIFVISISRESKGIQFRLSLKRWCISSTIFIFLLAICVWNHTGFVLDDIFFPDWHLTQIVKPVFIIGNARSGTTLFHRQLGALSKSKLISYRTWEILFGLSITFRRLFMFLYWLDCICGGYIYTIIAYIEHALVTRKISVHSIGLNEFEEDEWIMASAGLSQLLLLMFPLAMNECLGDLVYFDELPSKLRAQIFGFYLKCVQKRMYGLNDEIFLSKNPTFTLRLSSLFDTFPDARIVCLVRDPKESVPSMVSYIGLVWHTFSDPLISYPSVNQLVEFCFAHYLYPLEHLHVSKRPESVWLFVSYDDLINGIEGTMSAVCAHFAFPFAFCNEPLLENSSEFVSTHSYSIERCCGISEKEFVELFSEVYSSTHFKKDAPEALQLKMLGSDIRKPTDDELTASGIHDELELISWYVFVLFLPIVCVYLLAKSLSW